MYKDQITPQEYIILKLETRNLLHSIFGIPKSGATETITDQSGIGRLVSDGTTYKDLEILTFEKLLTFLGEAKPEDNVHSLFTKVVQRLESPVKDIIAPVNNVEEKVEESKESEIVKKVDPGIDGLKCELCPYATANVKALHMHRIGKHLNR